MRKWEISQEGVEFCNHTIPQRHLVCLIILVIYHDTTCILFSQNVIHVANGIHPHQNPTNRLSKGRDLTTTSLLRICSVLRFVK